MKGVRELPFLMQQGLAWCFQKGIHYISMDTALVSFCFSGGMQQETLFQRATTPGIQRWRDLSTKAFLFQSWWTLASINYSLVCSRVRTVVRWVRPRSWNWWAWTGLAHPWWILPSSSPRKNISIPLSRWNVLILPEEKRGEEERHKMGLQLLA